MRLQALLYAPTPAFTTDTYWARYVHGPDELWVLVGLAKARSYPSSTLCLSFLRMPLSFLSSSPDPDPFFSSRLKPTPLSTPLAPTHSPCPYPLEQNSRYSLLSFFTPSFAFAFRSCFKLRMLFSFSSNSFALPGLCYAIYPDPDRAPLIFMFNFVFIERYAAIAAAALIVPSHSPPPTPIPVPAPVPISRSIDVYHHHHL